jgi:DNA-binding transcriptional LysR family regulator
MLDWDDLRFFLAVARRGSLSAAAKELRVTQSTVGRRLATLEVRLGARLLNRTPDGYVPTLAGQSILGQVEALEAGVLGVERQVGGRDEELAGTVSVTSLDVLASHVLVPCFAALHSKHPDIEVDLLADTTRVSLAMRETDIAVRLTRSEQHDLVVRRIGYLAFGLYASAAYLMQHDGPGFEDGCPGHRLVTHLDDRENLPQAGWLARLAPRARVVLRSNSYQTQFEAAVAGEGMACLARFQADTDMRLQRLEAPITAPVTDIWLAVHGDNRHTPRIRVVLDAITQAIRGRASRLAPEDERLADQQLSEPATPPGGQGDGLDQD